MVDNVEDVSKSVPGSAMTAGDSGRASFQNQDMLDTKLEYMSHKESEQQSMQGTGIVILQSAPTQKSRDKASRCLSLPLFFVHILCWMLYCMYLAPMRWVALKMLMLMGWAVKIPFVVARRCHSRVFRARPITPKNERVQPPLVDQQAPVRDLCPSCPTIGTPLGLTPLHPIGRTRVKDLALVSNPDGKRVACAEGDQELMVIFLLGGILWMSGIGMILSDESKDLFASRSGFKEIAQKDESNSEQFGK